MNRRPMESITEKVAGVRKGTVITDSLDLCFGFSEKRGGETTKKAPENLREAEIKNELYSPPKGCHFIPLINILRLGAFP